MTSCLFAVGDGQHGVSDFFGLNTCVFTQSRKQENGRQQTHQRNTSPFAQPKFLTLTQQRRGAKTMERFVA